MTVSVEPVSGTPFTTGGTKRSILIARYSRMPIGSISNVDELVSLSMICHRCSDSQLIEYCAGEFPMFATEILNPAESPGAASRPSVPSGVMRTSSNWSMVKVSRCVWATVGLSWYRAVTSTTNFPERAYLGEAGSLRSASSSSRWIVSNW